MFRHGGGISRVGVSREEEAGFGMPTVMKQNKKNLLNHLIGCPASHLITETEHVRSFTLRSHLLHNVLAAVCTLLHATNVAFQDLSNIGHGQSGE